jgi:hypothetical protein
MIKKRVLGPGHFPHPSFKNKPVSFPQTRR